MSHSSLFALLALFVLAAAPVWGVLPLNLILPAQTVNNGGVVKALEIEPAGLEVLPELPAYHW